MSDVTLSSAVRSNLLSLQNTADLMSKTQERLATGLKVNSALDNPTNFFTASALNSRASDLGRLLDGVSNATQTLEAADNGISAITKLVESAQATARQALQTPATIDTVGPAEGGTLSGTGFTGPLDLTGGSTPATEGGVTASGSFSALTFTDQTTASETFTFAGPLNFDEAGDSITFDINVDGSGTSGVTITQAMAQAATGGSGNITTAAEFRSAITAALADDSVTGVTVGGTGTDITFTSSTAGSGGSVAVTNLSNADGSLGAGNFSNGGLDSVTSSVAGADADVLSFDIDVDGTNQTFSFNASEVNTALSGLTVSSVADLATLVNTKLTGATASDDSGSLRIESASTGTTSNVDVNSVTFNDDGAGAVATNDTGFNGTSGQTGTAGADAGAATDSVSFQVTLTTGGVVGSPQTVSFDAAAATAAGFTANNLTAANVASLINDDLTGATATVNDDGEITITEDTTGTGSAITIGPVTETAANGATGITAGTDAGVAETTTTGVNPARGEFVTQYNELMGQINELAEDSGFNGVNLLDGDNLSVIFNEDGSSTLDITGETFNATGLGLAELTSTGLDTDASINAVLGTLDTAIGTLRSQSSEFGSNLSIVETREDFTKSMINTLETGAANLTLADTNEEGANLLALQTRQQLSSTALSLASQADQNVLRLF